MAEYQLSINGRRVTTRGIAPEATLEKITVRYAEPRELVFKYAGEDALMNAEIELQVDGTVRFFGHVLDRSYPAGLVGGTMLYTAYGLEEKAGGISLVNTLNNFPVYRLLGLNMLQMFARLVDDTLSQELRDLGVEPEFVGLTTDQLPPITLRGNTLGEAMYVMTGGVPGFTWLIDPSTRKFLVVNVFDVPCVTVTIGDDAVPHRDMQIRESLRDRATAIVMIGQANREVVERAYSLSPAWNTSLESDWTIDAGQTGAGEMADVFRRFDFRPVAGEVLYDEMIELRQEVDTEDGPAEYSIDIAHLDPEGYVWSKSPMVRPVPPHRANKPNARLKGKSKPPIGAMLVYRTVMDTEAPWMNCPPTGYSGTAFDIYGLQRAKVVYEPNNDNITRSRVMRMHAAHCDVLYEGTVPLVGEVPEDLWNLSRRISIAKRDGVTGLENAKAVLREIEYNFRSNRTTLQLGGDKSLFTGEGMS